MYENVPRLSTTVVAVVSVAGSWTAADSSPGGPKHLPWWKGVIVSHNKVCNNYKFVLSPNGNCIPGSRSYSDLLDL